MQANSNTKRTLLNRISWKGIGVLLLVGLLGSVAALLPLMRSEAATNSTLNFQARLQNASGGIVADGYYNIEFKLYNVSSAGTALWTEDYIDTNGSSAGNDFRVRVKNGYISVNLGSLTAFPNTINWDQDLWLTMNVGGVAQTASPTWDGEMNPRLKVTSVPYAFRAGQLAVNSGSNTSTLSLAAPTGGSQNFVIPDQGAAGTYNLLTQSAANGSYIQNTTSQQTANFNISGNGVAGGYIDAVGGFRVNGTSGATTTCSGGQFLQNATTVGGIVTGGSCVAASNGVTTVGTIDSQTKSANGAVISGTTIYLQTADASNPGMVSTGAQTFAGAKTFNTSVASPTINATTALQTGGTTRIDASGNLSNIGTINSGAITSNGTLTLAAGANVNINDTGAGYTMGSLNVGSNSTGNLLTNPSFETNLSGWSTNNGTSARVTTASYSGVAAAEITVSSSSSSGLNASTSATVGNTYSFSAYARAVSVTGSPTATAKIEWKNSGGSVISISSGTAITLNSPWQRATVSGVAPAGTTSATVTFYATGATSGDKFMMDATQFESGGTSTAYVDGTRPAGSLNATGSLSAQGSISGNAGLSVNGDTVLRANTNGASTFQVQNSGGTAILQVNTSTNGVVVNGNLNVTGAYSVNGTAGATVTCSGGQFLQNATTVGGIVTGGSCAAVVGDGGVTTVGTIDSQTKSANGVVISGTNIYMQTADGTNPGLVSAGAQTFGGAKTFNGAITASGGISGNGSGLTTLNASNLSSGTVANGLISGSYTGITGTGALAAGSIASGFGTISTGNNITTTATVQGANVNATGNIQTGGTTRIDSSGNFTGTSLNVSGLVTATAMDVTGYATSNTSNTNAGQWTKLASCTLSAQYGDCRISAIVAMSGDGSSDTTKAQVDWRVKQQAAFGSDPVVRTEISNARTIGISNFSSVIISNAGPTVVELWGMIPSSYQTWRVSPILNGGSIRASFVSNQGFSTSLPAGTAIASVYSDETFNTVNAVGGYRFNGTSGATTTCSGGQFLQNAVVQGGIVTGGSCGTATSGVTTVGTIDSQTKTANGAVITGTSIVLQTADGSNPGMVSTGAQTFAGAKTFSGAANSSIVNITDGTATGSIFINNASGNAGVQFGSISNHNLGFFTANGSPSLILTTGGNLNVVGGGLQTNGTTRIDNSGNFNGGSVTSSSTVQGATVNATTGFQINGVAGAAVSCSGGQFLQNATIAGGIVTGGACATPVDTGVTTVGTFSATSIANGASISGNTITFGAADTSNPGMVTNGTQTFGGNKTISSLPNSFPLRLTDGTVTIGAYINNASGAAGGKAQFGTISNTDLAFITNNSSAQLILTTTGNLNLVSGAYQTNGTTRIDTSGNFTGNGANITSLNAGNISTGTLGIARGGTGSTSYTTNGVVYSNGSALVSTAAGATGQCLKGNTSAAPTWGACGTASTMQDTYDNSTSPQIQLNSTKGAVVYRDASTTIGNLFQLQNSAGTATYFSVSSSAVNLQNTSGNSVFSLNMGTGHLLVYNPANSANYADIYWDGTAGQAVFAASAGNTTRVGNGSGNISLQLTNAADVLVGTKTATLSSGYSSNDFSFTRNISAGANSLTGSVVKVESTSTGTGTVGSNLLWINENNNSATGNLILATKGGAGNNKFVVDTNGNTTAAGTITGAAGFVAAAGQAYTGAGAVTLSSGAGSALTLSGATGVSVNTGTGNLQIGSATTDNVANLLVLDSYNQASDPTGVNGAMYYNTSMNAFRCYENGAWKNCIFPQAQVFQVNDQTANSSSTTFQNSSDLAAPLAANSVYSFEAIIPINIGNTTADAKYTFTVPSGASIYTNGTAPLTSSTNVICNATASGQTCSVAVTASIQSVISVVGTVYTAGTAGNLQFQFAQNTSTATSNPVLMKGASIKYYKQ